MIVYRLKPEFRHSGTTPFQWKGSLSYGDVPGWGVCVWNRRNGIISHRFPYQNGAVNLHRALNAAHNACRPTDWS